MHGLFTFTCHGSLLPGKQSLNLQGSLHACSSHHCPHNAVHTQCKIPSHTVLIRHLKTLLAMLGALASSSVLNCFQHLVAVVLKDLVVFSMTSNVLRLSSTLCLSSLLMTLRQLHQWDLVFYYNVDKDENSTLQIYFKWYLRHEGGRDTGQESES